MLKADPENLVRRMRRVGLVTLAALAVLLVLSVATGEGLSPSNWTMVALIGLVGIGEVVGARMLRLDFEDPAGIPRREKRMEAIAVVVGIGLPLVALIGVLAFAIAVLAR
ncbi:MAG: hypothetical protein U0838_00760 [Chloroflexota bacterium]